MKNIRTTVWVTVLSAAFAFVEAAVVVYLRSVYYPEGFSFPLKLISSYHLSVELAREFATLLMLGSIGMLGGTTRWSRFAFFAIAFGVWDIFYYVWLKVTLDWPSSLLEWDVLFLLPVPWIGPVIAPVCIALLLITAGFVILRTEASGAAFRPPRSAWIVSVLGTAILLYTFMYDTEATLRLAMPQPYPYILMGVGLALYVVALFLAANDGIAK